MSRVSLQWFGAEVRKRIRAAEGKAVGQTLDAAAARARGSHRWKNRSGKLQDSIRSFGVNTEGQRVVGEFGYGRGYGLFQEIGFRGRAGDHTLRRAGDRQFTDLADRLRREASLG